MQRKMLCKFLKGYLTKNMLMRSFIWDYCTFKVTMRFLVIHP